MLFLSVKSVMQRTEALGLALVILLKELIESSMLKLFAPWTEMHF